MPNVQYPFLIVNPKAYLYGQQALELAKAADETARQSGLQIFFTCPFTDIRYIKTNTSHIIVTAQHMESLRTGRGMGHILPEALKEAGADAVFLNHAENPLTLAELHKTIQRARELELLSIVCADSVTEGLAAAQLKPDILLCEPTDLIGTGQTADSSYISDAVGLIKAADSNIAVMIASGISTAEDVYRVIRLGADGTGATSGIIKAPSPAKRITEMAAAALQASDDLAADRRRIS